MILKWPGPASLLTRVLWLLSTITRILDPHQERGPGERGKKKKKRNRKEEKWTTALERLSERGWSFVFWFHFHMVKTGGENNPRFPRLFNYSHGHVTCKCTRSQCFLLFLCDSPWLQQLCLLLQDLTSQGHTLVMQLGEFFWIPGTNLTLLLCLYFSMKFRVLCCPSISSPTPTLGFLLASLEIIHVTQKLSLFSVSKALGATFSQITTSL